MIDPWTTTRIPLLIRERRWWLLPLLAWLLTVSVSLQQHLDDLQAQSREVATEGARNLFNMVVLTRSWNAGHGGVYVPVTAKTQPNPWLVHPRRDLLTQDGQRLTMVNPAYMTRQIGELAQSKGGTVFHITSLKPIRPFNGPDAWEREALLAFEHGQKESIALLDAPARLRYMAPLKVAPPCMVCHASQGYKVGDVRGGISVTLPFAPMLAASEYARQQSWIKHAGVFLVISLLAWGLFELLRRRWHDLAHNLTALETARNAMQASNAELARARDEAESASRSKSAFLGAMSHELRTPLNGILGFAHLLQRAELPAKEGEQVRRIAEQGNRLLGLINEVMEFARLDSLSPPTRPGTLDPSALFAGLAEELRVAGAARGLGVRIELPPDLPARVAGEGAWLSACLRPLLNNAVKFTERGEVGLSVSCEPQGEGAFRLRVTVSDSGIGIAEVDHDKLFQPFRQLDDTTTRRYGGLGLGLAMSARYAGLLDARLDFTSEPGRGSRFTLEWMTRSLAAHAAESDAPAGPDEVPASLDELQRLLGEDDMRAVKCLAAIQPLLAQAQDAELVARLVQQVEGFDFPAALETLRELQGAG